MADTGTSFRRAYQAVLDRTPPAPAWDEIDAPPAPICKRARSRRSMPPWVIAGSAAALFLLVLGGAALLGLERGPSVTTVAPAPAAADAPPDTAAAEAVPTPGPLPVDRVSASSELANFEAKFLVDGTDRAWNDESLRGAGAELTFTFSSPVELDEIVVHHLTDAERFARNYRIARFEIHFDGERAQEATVPDEPGAHAVPVAGRASEVRLVVTDVYPAELFGGGPPFEELAVAEIEFIGVAAADPSAAAETGITSTAAGAPALWISLP